MGEKKKTINITYVKTPGDPLELIIEAIAPNIRSALLKHDVTLRMELEEILRKQARGEL